MSNHDTVNENLTPPLGKLIGPGYNGRMSEIPALAIVDDLEKHRFEAHLGDGTIAFAEYHLRHGKIIFTHTEVPAAHEGQGIGSALIRFALAAARERKSQVIPICSFFAAYIEKHAAEQDLLDPSYRTVLGLA